MDELPYSDPEQHTDHKSDKRRKHKKDGSHRKSVTVNQTDETAVQGISKGEDVQISTAQFVDDLPPVNPFPVGKRNIKFAPDTELEGNVMSSDGSSPQLFTVRDTLLPPLQETEQPPPTETKQTLDDTINLQLAVDHIIFFIHGIGGSLDGSGAEHSITKLKETIEFVRRQWFWPVHCELHIEMINWKVEIGVEQAAIFERIMSSKESSREWGNYLMSDVMFYMVPWRRAKMQAIVARILNARVKALRESAPQKFGKSKVSLLGYSLGSLITHDLLSAQADHVLNPEAPAVIPNDSPLGLNFQVNSVFLCGSPLAAYLSTICADGEEPKLELPNRINRYFNVIDSSDAISFRQEPLFFGSSVTECAPAVPLPPWRSPTGAKPKSLFNKLFGSVKVDSSGGSMPPKRRIDFVLQKSTNIVKETNLPFVGMILSHFSYFENRDFALFILRILTGFDPATVPE